jgi:hypothetical protein
MKKIISLALLCTISTHAWSNDQVIEHETCMLNMTGKEMQYSNVHEQLTRNGFKNIYAEYPKQIAIEFETLNSEMVRVPSKFLKKGNYSDLLNGVFHFTNEQGQKEDFPISFYGKGHSLNEAGLNFSQTMQEQMPRCVIKQTPLNSCKLTVTATVSGSVFYPYQDQQFNGSMKLKGSSEFTSNLPVQEMKEFSLEVRANQLSFESINVLPTSTADDDLVAKLQGQVIRDLTKKGDRFSINIARSRNDSGEYKVRESTPNQWSNYGLVDPKMNYNSWLHTMVSPKMLDQNRQEIENGGSGMMDVTYGVSLNCRKQ